MNFAVVALVGRMVLMFALMMLVPLGFAIGYGDGAADAFIGGLGVTLLAGAAMAVSMRRFRRELQPRDGFLLVALTWLVLPFFGALPLMFALPELSFTDAYFESMSGFSATGASVMSGLDQLPMSVNVWRCFLQYVGGLGIIVLVVAILPMLGVGGSQLFKAEITGPMKDSKLTPRISDTARGLWVVYFGLGVACTLAYRAAGMSWPDAFMHMCTTLSMGGLSSYDASFGHWDSPLLEAVAMVFMVLAGINFALYFIAWRQRSLWRLWSDLEVRLYVLLLLLAVLVVTTFLWWRGVYDDPLQALRFGAFNVISVATTTGYATADYGQWPAFAPWLMLLLGCVATCGGSTGGGIKMIRLVLLVKQSLRELVRIVHPNVVNPLVVNGRAVPDRVIHSVIAFMMIYGATLVAMTMLLVATGLDVVTAFTAVVATVNNIGPGLGEVGPSSNFSVLSDFQTWVCSMAMMLGRLELLSVLVLLTPQFWRK